MKWLCILAMLAGCSTEPKVVTNTVKVAVPTPCLQAIPEVPSFRLRALTGDEELWVINRSLTTDIELHEAYEDRLLTALEACKK
jgi:hypothetical protein